MFFPIRDMGFSFSARLPSSLTCGTWKVKMVWKIDYDLLLKKYNINFPEDIDYLFDQVFPYEWAQIYKENTKRTSNIIVTQYNGFTYYYDNFQELEVKGLVKPDISEESRLVVCLGKSRPDQRYTKLYEKNHFEGPTELYGGKDVDKGHFIAHSIGGGMQINLFFQKREINRGKSDRGKVFRRMETFCSQNPGTILFCRPFYNDGTSRPNSFEYGIFQDRKTFWIEVFDN